MTDVVCYARVSRDDLHCENQKKIIKEYCERNNILEYDYFQEEESTRKTRPIKEEVIQKCRAGIYKTIIISRLDRFARSIPELIMDVEGFVNSGGRFISILNGFDFQKNSYNASQQLMLGIFASFAQFEREITRERTMEGLARARSEGKVLGRPKGISGKKYNNPSQESIKILMDQGKSIRDIAKLLGASKFMISKKIDEIKKLNHKI